MALLMISDVAKRMDWSRSSNIGATRPDRDPNVPHRSRSLYNLGRLRHATISMKVFSAQG